MEVSYSTGALAELDYLLDLEARRTPGRIQARANMLQIGAQRIIGFSQAVDAHYLAQAANALPRLVADLRNASAVIQSQRDEIARLQKEVALLQSQVKQERQKRQTVQDALRHAKHLVRQLTRRRKEKTKVKVETKIHEEIRYQVVDVPATWQAPDGKRYELVYFPTQFETAQSLEVAAQ